MRSSRLLIPAVALGIAWGTSCRHPGDFQDPGVDPRFLACMANAGATAVNCMSVLDGGMLGDAGMIGDSGMLSDGGNVMGPLLIVPPGPALFAISTQPGMEALSALPLDICDVDAGSTVTFVQFHWAGLMIQGLDPGSGTGIAYDPHRAMIHMSLHSPARVVMYQLRPMETDVTSETYVGSVADDVSRPVVAADGGVVCAANPTKGSVQCLTVPDGNPVSSATSTKVPDLVAPSWLNLTSDSRLVVGSNSASASKVVVFDDVSTLAYDGGSSVSLVDGTTIGNAPASCTTVPGRAYLYCSSRLQAAGNPGALWKITPGAAAKMVLQGLTAPGLVVASPKGERLYVADGNTLKVFWIQDPFSDQPGPAGAVPFATAISDMAISPDDTSLYVTSVNGGWLTQLSTLDLSVVCTRPDLSQPGPITVSPQ